MDYQNRYILMNKSKMKQFLSKRNIYDYLTTYFLFADVFI